MTNIFPLFQILPTYFAEITAKYEKRKKYEKKRKILGMLYEVNVRQPAYRYDTKHLLSVFYQQKQKLINNELIKYKIIIYLYK